MKKTILVLILSLFINIYSMEQEQESINIKDLPSEIKYIFLEHIIKDLINNWNDIFNFDRHSLKETLDRFCLINRDFLLEVEVLKNLVKRVKEKRFAYLINVIKQAHDSFSKEELNKKLFDILDCEYSDDQDQITSELREAVKLIFAGADINTSGGGGTTLSWAAFIGHLETVKLLIDNNADVNIKSVDGKTPLMEASWNGHIAIVKLLLDKGADINTTDNIGITALFEAIDYGHKEQYPQIVKLLIDKGANLNTKDKYGEKVLRWATVNGHTEIVELIKSYENTQNK